MHVTNEFRKRWRDSSLQDKLGICACVCTIVGMSVAAGFPSKNRSTTRKMIYIATKAMATLSGLGFCFATRNGYFIDSLIFGPSTVFFLTFAKLARGLPPPNSSGARSMLETAFPDERLLFLHIRPPYA